MLLCFVSIALAEDPELELLPDAPLAVLPFGVAEFAWNQPGRGAVYAVTQALGAGVATWGGVNLPIADAAGDDAGAEAYQTAMGIGVAVAAVSYAVSVVDGSRLAEARARAAREAGTRREAVLRFDVALAAAPRE
ncbi:MAG: hypothetical protein EXR71_06715 [Myxococcales bacterium]|nr:hypothetical protein [Myxococcales bacterium]